MKRGEARPLNLLTHIPEAGPEEHFETLIQRAGVRIERIVSHGQVTPPDRPFVQSHDEWVLVLSGRARLRLADQEEVTLEAGDHRLIPAGLPHRVTFTDEARPTIWLAVHFGP